MPKSEHIAKCVAEWMAGKFNRQRELYQSDAVSGIIKNFGKEFISEDYGWTTSKSASSPLAGRPGFFNSHSRRSVR